ncbi:MAG TPA: hydantoinase/oxoprolinase N-terminal domain-containing protein, partial [Candidatus Binataceae bacterium]|nr:hydantoinase/oxoprolinase N-terminal domain-containing protein [Candidatus Binataceae bacterium]
MGHVLGIDIGGTFTDFSLVDDQGRITLWKEATTPKDPAQGVKDGLNHFAQTRGVGLNEFLGQLDLFVHGSTIATNTVVQRNGPPIGLICTEGFRDVIYLRDGFKPERYNWNLKQPEDFVP